MEGVLIWRWDLTFPGWRWLCEPLVGVSTPCRAVSTRWNTILFPGLLELIFGNIYDSGMRP